MGIKIRLFATLREGRGKEVEIKAGEGMTGSELINTLEIEEKDVAIFLINGKDATLEDTLQEGDVISIFPPVGGG
ncbi:MAG: MoaD/ThiS family protein [Tindallia sp. MSAO_Bac2]|nr:MAG: MoaD/ThiS family protein [Tindallia sp. MSAO_Bac2]